MTARVSFDFTGTTALITGGTSGIGHATAVLFRDAGAEVTITGTKPAATDYDTDLSGMAYHQLQIDEPIRRMRWRAASTGSTCCSTTRARISLGALMSRSRTGSMRRSRSISTGPYRLTVGLYRALKASDAPGGASVVNLASMSALRAVPHGCPAMVLRRPGSSASREISLLSGRTRESG